ncbi:MAG TPA: class I SAM-dependent methyltransferase [Vicinamibacteria bacterium]|nr:class I SAM-dependent methyltransferase [Vicinamibacteria bacterium]
MGLFARLVERISDHPVLFVFIRGIVENGFRAIRAVIRRQLKPGTGVKTLDLGCGPGAFAADFKGDEYVGVDLNPRYVAYATAHCPGRFICRDARETGLPGSHFDQILIFGLLHHLPDDAVRSVLDEALRVLRPGGSILVIEDIPSISKLNLIGRLIHRAENGEHIRPPDAYRHLYGEKARIGHEEVLQSGLCDYYAAVLLK